MNEYHYAICVGINRYPGISDLSGPINDATVFRDWAVRPTGGGVSPANARLIVVDPARPPARKPYDAEPKLWQMTQALEETADKAGADIGDDPMRWDQSRLYIFLAGHGVAPAGSDGALLSADAHRGAFGANFDIRSHVDWLRNCAPFREVVILADCCRNRFANATAAGIYLDSCPVPRAETHITVGYATALGDPAYEQNDDAIPADDRRGFFTTALMEALDGDSGAADAAGDVTVASLSGWLRKRVEALTRGRPVPQRVEMNTPSVPIVLRRGVSRPRHRVVIRFPAEAADPVRLTDSDFVSIGTWNPGDGDWPVNLSDGLYQVVLDGAASGLSFRNEGFFRVTGEGRDVAL